MRDTETDSKTHNTVHRWNQEPMRTRRNGGIYLLPAHEASHTNTPAAAVHLPASFGFSEGKAVLTLLSFKAISPRTKLFLLSSSPPLFFPQHLTIQLHLSLCQPGTATEASYALTLHTNMHTFSPQDRKLDWCSLPSPTVGFYPFCQCLQTTGESDDFQSLRNINWLIHGAFRQPHAV